MSKVFSEVERRCTFFVTLDAAPTYRQLPDSRTWKAEGKFGPDEEHAGTGQLYPEDIGDSIVWQLFAPPLPHQAEDTAVIETCDGGPQWTTTIDLDRSPFTRKSIEKALQTLADMLNKGEDFYADAPQIVNRGTKEYPDCTKVFADLDIPQRVKDALIPKPPKGQP